MDIGTISLVLLVGLLVLLAIGMPLGLASAVMAVAVLVMKFEPALIADPLSFGDGLLTRKFGTGPLNILAQKIYGLLTDYVLISIPLFIFMAALLERSGIAKGMYTSLNVWLSGVRGGIAGDFTVTKMAGDEYWIIGSGMAERYHQRFWAMVPLPEGTTFTSRTEATCGFNVAGPKSRDLLQRLSNADLSNEAWPFMRSGRLEIAGVECGALRVSFTGDLGWEIYCHEPDQVAVYAALIEAAKALEGGPVGSRALMSLRVEKGYGSWSREYSPEYWPQETGLERLIKLDKEFLHKAAYLALKDNAPREVLRLVEVLEVGSADATGGEPIFLPDGTPVGKVTSGTYGYSVGKSLALAYLKGVEPGAEVDVMILGRPHRGRVLAGPPFDPKGERLRG